MIVTEENNGKVQWNGLARVRENKRSKNGSLNGETKEEMDRKKEPRVRTGEAVGEPISLGPGAP